ncbi:hypothetical protein F3Y22_tig00110267pilonHSYRG00007 [Hibiscus syriacus]|uniref:Uncharacterized protein n=1 Tax=Hibiscus syriacus TaxID=106335 RepID=A0A6A3B591_HIBSY|nr:hypothetical protein F3Y22_tig00110267pilonHSYRG00007 [Hibiscus syriacus]
MFSGSIPQGVWELKTLTELVLRENNFSGSIPASIGNLTTLSTLSLHKTKFYWSIPKEELDLSSNCLTGEIPRGLGALKMMSHLLLSGNQFSGKIPYEIGLLSNLEQLKLASNNLSGFIPDQLGNCLFESEFTYWRHPRTVRKITVLGSIEPFLHMLNGSIPEAFNEMHGLRIVNISFNQLEGPIPDLKAFLDASFHALGNNKDLCGNATGLRPCVVPSRDNRSHGRRTNVVVLAVLPLLGGLLSLFILAGIFSTFCNKTPTRKSEPMEEQHGDIFTVLGFNGRVLHDGIIEATEDFSSDREDMELFIKLHYQLVKWMQ